MLCSKQDYKTNRIHKHAERRSRYVGIRFREKKTELFSTTKPNGKKNNFFSRVSVLAMLYNNGICEQSEEQKI